MAKKTKTLIPVFVTQSACAMRIGFAGNKDSSREAKISWHDFFFARESHPIQGFKVHIQK